MEIGQKTNRLLFLKETESKFAKNGNRKRMGLFKCDCGKEKIILIFSVRSEVTKSCGCYVSEKTSKANIERKTHGMSRHNLYARWQRIKSRCLTKSNKRYSDYGGRGITICEEWKNDFMSFYNWAINNGYSPELGIDRIENNGNYEPSNCRFVTIKKNNNNTRQNIIVEYNGMKITLMEACEMIGFERRYTTIWHRMKKGKTFLEAVKSYIG